MSKKKIKEWYVDGVWGKVATISWGEPEHQPVLLVHGYMDSSATFISLVEYLPDDYYYVSFDFPGQGKSDHMPVGPLATATVYIEVINTMVKHLKWEQFYVISHSLGYIYSIFYNAAYPGQIIKIVGLDCFPAIADYYYYDNSPEIWYNIHYGIYYDNYEKNFEKPKGIPRERALQQVMKVRNLNKEQAEVVLSRSLVPTDNGLYKYSWQSMAKRIVQIPTCNDTVEYIITNSVPPTLILNATINEANLGVSFATKVMEKLMKDPKHTVHYFEGFHDFHIIDAGKLAPFITDFLKQKDRHNTLMAKL